MPKRLDVTPKIQAALKKATDGAVDGSTVAVFETISLNTKPLKKRGLFNGGVVTEGTLHQMADYVNAGNNVPLHTLHLQGEELPVGKVFLGEIFKTDQGLPELRSLFYVPLDKVSLVNDLENDVINEVSIGMQTMHINCSECGWDYMSAESNFSNLYNGVCANDHIIGENGVHVMLNGLDRWYEQSLVSLGAANGAKIQSRTKSLMGAENYDKLAASGHNPEITVLNATFSLQKEPPMDLTALVANLTDTKVELSTIKNELLTTKSALEAATTQVAAKDTEIVSLKAAAAAYATSDAATVQVKLTAAEAASEKARAAMLAEATRMCVALALTAPAADSTIEVLLALMDTNRTKMSAAFPTGGAATTITAFAQASAQPSPFKGA